MQTETVRQATEEGKSVEAVPRTQPVRVAVQRSARGGELSAADQPPISSGLVQLFGLDVRVAGLTVIVDALIFGSDALSMGLMIPVGIAAAGVLGLIVYRAQRKWFGDDQESALIKALVIGLLTAIPVPIAPLLAIPGGCLGLIQQLRRR